MNENESKDFATGQVLGIDVGWSEKLDTTGACVLSWTADEVSLEVHHVPTNFERRTSRLKEIVGTSKFEAVALDGPLRPGLDLINEYRLGELLLTRRFSNSGFGKPGQSSSPNGLLLNEHANLIAKSVITADCVAAAKHQAAIHRLAIVEAFPTTFLAVMLDKDRRPSSKAKSDIFYEWLMGPDAPCRHAPDENRLEKLILMLLPGRTVTTEVGTITDHEHRAAVICAITALCAAKRQYVAVGDTRNGYLILPPATQDHGPGTQPWAMNAIRKNALKAKDWQGDGLAQFPPGPHVIEQHDNDAKTDNAAYVKAKKQETVLGQPV